MEIWVNQQPLRMHSGARAELHLSLKEAVDIGRFAERMAAEGWNERISLVWAVDGKPLADQGK